MHPEYLTQLANALTNDYRAVQQQVLNEILDLTTKWADLTPPRRLHDLKILEAEIRDILTALDSRTATTVQPLIQAYYEGGATVTALLVNTVPTFSSTDGETVAYLAQDLYADLLKATNGVREDVKMVIRDLTRNHVRNKIYTGKTSVQAAKDLTADLTARGITAVTYKNGTRMPLAAYAEMVVRTKTAETYQEAGLSQGDKLEIIYYEIFDGPGCGLSSHGDPLKADGLIVDAETAKKHVLSHPQCRRSTSPRPDIITSEDALRAKRLPRGVYEEAVNTVESKETKLPVAVAKNHRVTASFDLRSGVMSPAQARSARRVERRNP